MEADRNSSYSGLGSLTPGKRSEMMPSNSGMSGDKNWRERERERGRTHILNLLLAVFFYHCDVSSIPTRNSAEVLLEGLQLYSTQPG